MIERRPDGPAPECPSCGTNTVAPPGRGSETVIQCQDCEFFSRGPAGQMAFRCDPFTNLKEPECLAKWQILRTTELGQRMERMVAAYEATLQIYKRLEPLQEKMFRHMEHEIEDLEEGDSWKYDPESEEDESEEDEEKGPWSGPKT